MNGEISSLNWFKLELVFNELSTRPLSANISLANQRVANLIACFTSACRKQFTRIRFPVHFHEIEISQGFGLQDWLAQPGQKNLKDLLLGARRYPFVREGDNATEEIYFHYTFRLEIEGVMNQCLGLSAAHLYDTIAIGFGGAEFWERNFIPITKTQDATGIEESVLVPNVFSISCLNIKEIIDFIERVSQVHLIKTSLAPRDKKMHFREDHGKDVLAALGEKILRNPYVTDIINSLAWHPHETNFIRRIHPNGIIEIVLHWTDQGIGMAVQTTGRNWRETEAIAKILENEYGN